MVYNNPILFFLKALVSKTLKIISKINFELFKAKFKHSCSQSNFTYKGYFCLYAPQHVIYTIQHKLCPMHHTHIMLALSVFSDSVTYFWYLYLAFHFHLFSQNILVFCNIFGGGREGLTGKKTMLLLYFHYLKKMKKCAHILFYYL